MNGKDGIEILYKAWHGRIDKPDCPNFDDINEALVSVEKDLKVLEILKKHLFIRIDDGPAFDNLYAVSLQEDEDQCCDYTVILVSEEEKEKIKEWLKNFS